MADSLLTLKTCEGGRFLLIPRLGVAVHSPANRLFFVNVNVR